MPCRSGLPAPAPNPDAKLDIGERVVELVTADGTRLVANWFVPGTDALPAAAMVVVACGAGIPARFYHRLARYLAGRGAAVLTFDYRGIGASRSGSLRGAQGGMDLWAVQDIAAALAHGRGCFADLPIGAVAHSVGALLLGAAPGAEAVARAVFLGPHTGYWRDYRARWRIPLFATWHVLMPAITRAIGYFPGRLLRLGEDLPAQVALDWAGRRQPQLVGTARDAQRFGPSLFRYDAFEAATLAISMTDDAFAPPGAARTLLAMYHGVTATHEVIAPADIHARRLGHFGFFRRGARETIWPRVADWLMPAA
ncbi:MAG: alpha/beta hydrolase [Casimicrobiaceae bacterium]